MFMTCNNNRNDFVLFVVFEGDSREVRLATQVESDRDSWIGSLHVASYECMKIQLQSLREQLRSRTGKDPFSSQELTAVTSLQETTGGIFVTSFVFFRRCGFYLFV